MDLRLYLHILCHRWWIVVVLPLLVALLSGVVALARPARYGSTVRLLVTRSTIAAGSSAGLTDAGEDKTSLDLPAIVSGTTFRHDLAEALAQAGRPLGEAALVGAITASNQDHVVTIASTFADPDDAQAIAQAAVVLIQTNGLRYWGDSRATPANPGLDIGVLDPPGPATLLSGPRAIVAEVAARAMLALIAAIGIVFALHALEAGYRAQAVGRAAQVADKTT